MSSDDALLTVAIDCAHERQSEAGVTRYSRSLRAALDNRSDVKVIPLGGGSRFKPGTFRKKLNTLRQDFWWYPHEGRAQARRKGATIYHCPSSRGPLTTGRTPTVLSIHDLASFRFPETLTGWTRLYERTTLPRIARAADRVLASSANTASDVETILRVPANRIRVVPLGVDERFYDTEARPHATEQPYVLFVGTPQPRKNLPRLAMAVESLRRRGVPLRLVVAGAHGWGAAEPLGTAVEFAGQVDDDRLRSLYRGASCVALVSLHEGFGFPAVEAMAMGTPVVASTGGSLPEVVGDAAVVVDPLSTDCIATGIEEAIARRDELVERGRIRAARYTWRATAERTVAVYRELL